MTQLKAVFLGHITSVKCFSDITHILHVVMLAARWIFCFIFPFSNKYIHVIIITYLLID